MNSEGPIKFIRWIFILSFLNKFHVLFPLNNSITWLFNLNKKLKLNPLNYPAPPPHFLELYLRWSDTSFLAHNRISIRAVYRLLVFHSKLFVNALMTKSRPRTTRLHLLMPIHHRIILHFTSLHHTMPLNLLAPTKYSTAHIRSAVHRRCKG